MQKKVVVSIFPLIFLGLLTFVSCEKRSGENKYSIYNIVKASVAIIKKKGISQLSNETVNEEIAKMYVNEDDLMQKKTTIRQLTFDKANDYRIIFEDRIDEDRYKKVNSNKDPFRK